MDKTTDVTRLCPDCGHALDVKKHPEQAEGEAPLYALRCPECRWERLDTTQPTRELTPGEVRLLARITTLEDALRWRVTAEEMPPVEVDVVGDWGGICWPYEVARWDGYEWGTKHTVGGVAPDRWLPIPGAPELSQGADVPEGE